MSVGTTLWVERRALLTASSLEGTCRQARGHTVTTGRAGARRTLCEHMLWRAPSISSGSRHTPLPAEPTDLPLTAPLLTAPLHIASAAIRPQRHSQPHAEKRPSPRGC